MKRVVFVFAVAIAGCGEGDLVQTELVPQALGTFRAGLTAGQAGGCSTSVVQGLTDQLIEELNCVSPNLMVNFSGSHTTLYSAVQPYLAPGASSALKNATTQANDSITISSAYRSLAQQYLLYKWYKAGQCNIQAAAVPGSSNHQSGRAIDTPYYSAWRAKLEGNGWRWYGSGDVVHFDYLSSPNVSSKSILAFQKLWNKNNASKLAEDSQWGPATQNAMANSPVSGFANHGCQATQTTGTLIGIISQNGNTADRVSGATVTAGGKSAVTGTDGKYEFALAAGTYTVTASKSGYASSSLSKTVTAGQTIWGSMNLTANATTGTLSGVVSAQGGAAISGATVTAGGKTSTTDGSGSFSFTLAAGSYALNVSKQGFAPHASSRSVTAGNTTSANVALVASATDSPPTLAFDAPLENANSDFAAMTVRGTVSDDGPAIAEVTVRHNGGAAVSAPVVAGLFELDLKLAPGANLIEAEAIDSAGNKGLARVTAHFRAGLSGVVHTYDQADARIGNAEVSLVDAQTADSVGVTRTDEQGRFSFDLAVVPAVYVVTVRADGYVAHTQTVSVGDESRTSLDVGLTPGADGEYSIRFIEPTPGLVVYSDLTTISGVVSGIQVAAVTVNGEPAHLLGTSAFVINVPVAEGLNTYEVVAESPEHFSITAKVEVSRPVSDVQGQSCAVAPMGTLPLLALGAAIARIGRRRRNSSRA